MTAAPAIKGWCPTLLSPMQSGDGWLARVKPSAGDVERRSCAVDRRRRAPPRQRSHRPHLARQFAGQGPQPSLGGRLRRDDHRRQVSPIPTHRWKRSAMSWRARSGPTIPLPPSTLMPLRATSKPCSAGEPALWALPSKFGVLVDGGGVLPLADITADIMVRAARGEACRPSRRRDACRACATARRSPKSVKALGARFPSPVRATEREAAPHARAGDGGRRGGDLRRCWS